MSRSRIYSERILLLWSLRPFQHSREFYYKDTIEPKNTPFAESATRLKPFSLNVTRRIDISAFDKQGTAPDKLTGYLIIEP